MYFALITFVVYFLQLTRDIYSGDLGDLVTSACAGGVPHPPGYPLFTLIGHTLCSIPFPLHALPPVTRVALLSAAASALGVYLFYRFSLRITRNSYLALMSASILAFSYLFWLHAELPEVFGLHNLFVIALIYLAYDYYEKPSSNKLYRLAALTGLALSHHQTILFVGPTLAIFALARWKTMWEHKRSVIYSLVIAAVLFLFPYIYVFISAAKDPIINWGDVKNIKELIFLIERRAYGGFAPSVKNGIPAAVKTAVMHNYFVSLVSNFSYQILFLATLGLVQLFKTKQRVVGTALLIGFILTGPLFVGYAATYYTTITAFGIIERFFNTSFIILMFFVPFGFVFLDEFLQRFTKKTALRLILLSYFLIIPISMFIYNRPKTDLSKTQIGNTLAFDILDNLPKNSVLFVSGDTTTFNIWYARFILHRRPDVDIINPPGVGNNKFLNNELTKFHETHRMTKVSDLLTPTLDYLYKKRPMFATYETEIKPSDTLLMPRGLVYQFVDRAGVPAESDYVDLVTQDLRRLHKTRKATLTIAEQNLVVTEIPLIYSNGYLRVGDFIDSQYKDPKGAEPFYRLALWRDEESSGAYAGLALAQYKGYRDCVQALSNIQQALDIYPVWNTFYIQRYILSKNCNVKPELLKAYKQDYTRRFQNDIDDVLQKKYNISK